MPLIQEFKNSLKNPWAEEPIDLMLFRPLSFLFVKILLPFPITPNQVSGLAMASGIAAGCFFAGGDRAHFILAGIFYGLSNILDCCDGMIARLKKNGTITGRIVDGVVDYVAGGAAYIGLGIGLTKAVDAGTVHLPCNVWILIVAAAASTALHSVISDYYRNAFLRQTGEAAQKAGSEREQYAAELNRLTREKGHALDTMLIRVYLRYVGLQTGKAKGRPAKLGGAMVLLWNCIGPSTHIFFLVLAACLFRPSIFFIFTVLLANLWTIFLSALQVFKHASRVA